MPDFWRTEVWHPLSVHFPVALLIFATCVRLIAFFLRSPKDALWEKMGSIVLFTGSLLAWVSIYTGNLADGIVSRQLCDPTVLKAHENAAYISTYLFTAAALVDLGSRYLYPRLQSHYAKKILLVLLLTLGSGYLTYAGHLGATVVYQQGGGVYHPSADCAEFE